MMMKAVVKTSFGDGAVELLDVPKPSLSYGQVLVEVKAAGVCGSDIHFYRGRYDAYLNPPVILGHEFSGAIAEIGEGVDWLNVGSRITVETHARVCERCIFCNTGQYNLCIKRAAFGYGTNGAFTSYVAAPAKRVHMIPENISFDEAALTEPTAVVHHAIVDRTPLVPGCTVVILGPGPIGLLTLQFAKRMGAGFVAITGLTSDRNRLDLAEKLGADLTIDVGKEDPVSEIKRITHDYGADIVFETSGSAQAMRQAIQMTRNGGQITRIGHGAGEMKIDLDPITVRQITIKGTFSHTWKNWEGALQEISSGRVSVKDLITHRLPISQWKKAFELMERQESIKIILYPSKN
ncbi:MAG: zinc-dependent alcohol dehydrogenase [Thermoproteota archaeon]